MVEQNVLLDTIFNSLAHHIRRDILKRVLQAEQSISELSEAYKMSFAAIAKHIVVLERAGLVRKQKRGREQIISANPKTVMMAKTYLEQYQALWNKRFDALDSHLKK